MYYNILIFIFYIVIHNIYNRANCRYVIIATAESYVTRVVYYTVLS